ncbi:MAG: peptidylprolyl isomerase [Clostridia bacterium]|nr:peptidylprolyl isomerase [Clostridia bacterium]
MKKRIITALLLTFCLLIFGCAKKEEVQEEEFVLPDLTGSDIVYESSEFLVTKGAFEYMYHLNYRNSIEPYMTYYGLDPQKSFDEQYVDEENTVTLKDYLCESTATNLYNCILFAHDALENCHEDPENTKTVDDTVAALQEQAENAGISLEDYLKQCYGESVTLEDVKSVVGLQAYAYSYNDVIVSEKLEQMTEEDYESYYNDNYTEELDSDATRSVGHILISFDFYDNEELALEKAQDVLALWKEGEMSRESFEELASEYNDDSNCIYEKVTKGQMVAEFEDWLFAPERYEGETGIVKTVYGYHIMYYVGEDEPAWREDARNSYINGIMTEYTENLTEIYGEKIAENKEIKALVPDIIPQINL